LTLPYLTMLE